MQKIDQGGPVYYEFEQWLDSPALTHGVFTRNGGVSSGPFDSLNVGGTVGDDPKNVRENFRRIYDALELDGERACTVWQIHSADTVIAGEVPPGRRWLARADGMITDQPGLPLTMRYADCVPILFYDPDHHAAGIAHAGWRGTALQTVAGTLHAMQLAYQTDPARVQAGIGPSIGPDHYQVGPEVVAAIADSFGTSDALVHQASDGTFYLDLWAANQLALERAGVQHIEVAGLSTAANVGDFYSHRAEKGRTGRFCAVIALKDNSA